MLEEGIIDRGLDALVSTTGCLKVCDRGPVMAIYPNNWRYGGINEDRSAVAYILCRQGLELDAAALRRLTLAVRFRSEKLKRSLSEEELLVMVRNGGDGFLPGHKIS